MVRFLNKIKHIPSILTNNLRFIKMASDLIEIDGSLLEGGGQILRIALTMSTLCKKPVHITNIRAGRTKPGLMDQHLTGLKLVTNISSAQVSGDTMHSQEVKFDPKHIYGGEYTATVRTAGSISLLLQVALPCTLFASSPTTLILHGGTNAEMAPQIDYMTEVFRVVLEKFDATFDFDLIKRGYFPKGGGKVIIRIRPVRILKPVIMMEQGEITKLYGWSFVAGRLPIDMAHSMANSAVNELKCLNKYINIEKYKENKEVASENCSGIILVAETSTGCILGGSALRRKTETPEETGQRAGKELLKSLKEGACVDEHCQDQVIVFMALANGLSRIKVGEITMHTKTAIYVVEKMTNVKFNILQDGRCSIIECNGMGIST